MAKDRDLFDYLSLGNDLLQTSRLGDIREGQAALVALEAKRWESEQRQEIAELQEDNIRDFVFGASKWLQTLQARFAQSKPLATLALLYGLQGHIDDLNISTERVRSYEDKEKVHAFLEDVKRAVSDCEARLDADGVRDAVTCAKYKAEAPALTVVIEYEKEQLELRQRQEELKNMGPPKTIHNLPRVLAALIFVLGLAPLLLLFIGTGLAPDEHVSYTSVDVAVIITAIVLTLLGGWGMTPKGKNEALLLKEAIDAELETSGGGSEIVESLRKNFGDGDLQYYRNIQADRKAFIEKVLVDADNPT